MGHAALGHMLAHMVLRGLVYGLIWKMLRNLTLPETAGLVVIVVALFWLVVRANRSRSPWP
jgi:4-amino-4-deoxy-L-arabinose transferase-like glycosyltransferase